MTLRGTVQVNSEAIGAIAVLQNRSWLELYLPKEEEEEDDDQEFLGLGTRNRNSFVSLKAHRFMTRNKRRAVDL